ncbi:MAG: hypothetical protein WC023_12040 [Rhodocyclaceae bacterium]
MSEIAKASGITREALYKALAPMHIRASIPSTACARRWASSWWRRPLMPEEIGG